MDIMDIRVITVIKDITDIMVIMDIRNYAECVTLFNVWRHNTNANITLFLR